MIVIMPDYPDNILAISGSKLAEAGDWIKS